MNEAYLLTGGNMGDRKHNLARAKELIGKKGGSVQKASGLYETAAWGKTDQPAFFNQALLIKTALEPIELLQELLEVEKQIGRVRLEKYGPRIIDIDILLYGNKVLKSPSLTLPHPELPNRRFALAPLAEIAPSLIHPVLHKTIAQLLNECNDKLPVKKI